MGALSYSLIDKDRHWAHGKSLDYSYELESGQYIRIVVHQRKKREESENLDVKPHWWDHTAHFEAEINPTEMDTQVVEESQLTPTLKDKVSPAKKREKLVSGVDINKPGPGQWPLHDLGGTGDCGWGVLAYGLACASTRSWKDSPSEEQRFVEKIKEVGGLLRTTIHDLLGRADWEASRAKDDQATPVAEDGVAETLVQRHSKQGEQMDLRSYNLQHFQDQGAQRGYF